jgi:hypothetical protein
MEKLMLYKYVLSLQKQNTYSSNSRTVEHLFMFSIYGKTWNFMFSLESGYPCSKNKLGLEPHFSSVTSKLADFLCVKFTKHSLKLIKSLPTNNFVSQLHLLTNKLPYRPYFPYHFSM